MRDHLMELDTHSIPVIDVASLLDKVDNPDSIQDSEVVDIACKLHKACMKVGFFYIKGHGVPEYLTKRVREVAREFFDLPFQEKLSIKMTASTGYRGYQKVGENITEGIHDMHEAIDCYKDVNIGDYGLLGKVIEGKNLWPAQPKDFSMLMENYVMVIKDLCRKIMRGIAIGMGCPPDIFEGRIAGDPFWVLRIIGYPASDGSAIGSDVDNNGIGCGAHTDYGLLTIVNQDEDITALQIKNKVGEWIWAPPISGTFVCNIGDMLKILTNGLYESTLHRVINKNPNYRVSVPFFYEPNFDKVIEPLEYCKELTGGISQLEPAIYGEHLNTKVLENFIEDVYL